LALHSVVCNAGGSLLSIVRRNNNLLVDLVSPGSGGNATLKPLMTIGDWIQSSSTAVDNDVGLIAAGIQSPDAQHYSIFFYQFGNNALKTKAINYVLSLLEYSSPLKSMYALGYAIQTGYQTLKLLKVNDVSLGFSLIADTHVNMEWNENLSPAAAIDPINGTYVLINGVSSQSAMSISLSTGGLVSNVSLWQSGVISLDWDAKNGVLFGIVYYAPQTIYYLAKIDAGTGSFGFYAAVQIESKTAIWSTQYSPEIRTLYVQTERSNGALAIRAVNIDTGATTTFSNNNLGGILPSYVVNKP